MTTSSKSSKLKSTKTESAVSKLEVPKSKLAKSAPPRLAPPKLARFNSSKRNRHSEMKTKSRKERGRFSSSNRGASSNGATLPPVEISVAEFVNDPHCYPHEAGEKIYELIFAALKQKRPVRLSYRGVEEYVSATFNQTAIGKLYEKFKPKKIGALLEVVDMTERQKTLFDIDVKNHRNNLKLSRKQKRDIEAILRGDYGF